MIALLTAAALAGTITDATGATVQVQDPARIITLSGGVTETVHALGLGDRIVGVDSGSRYPEAATKVAQLGYHRQLSAEGVLSLTPDLVIATEDTGPPSTVEQLKAADVPVVILPATPSIQGARTRIELAATLLDRPDAGARILASIDEDLASLSEAGEGPRVVFVYARGGGVMNIAGTRTAAHSMIEAAGAIQAIDSYSGYRPLTPEALVAAAPEVIVFTTGGLQAAGGIDAVLKMPGVALTPAGKARRIIALDDLLLLGLGPRTGEAATALAQALGNDAP